MSVLLNENFESGSSLAALGFTNIGACSNQSGGGLRGSTWGVRGTTNSWEFRKLVSPANRTFTVSADGDWAGFLSFPAMPIQWIFELRNPGNFVSVQIGDADGSVKLWLFLNGAGLGLASGSWDVITPGTAQNVRICGRQSDPGVENGSIQLYIDNTLLFQDSGIYLGGGPTTSPLWDRVEFGGSYDSRLDNLYIDDDGCSLSPQVNDTLPCCADGSPQGGSTGLNPDPVGLLPPWIASCENGGMVEILADLADGESWL